MKRFVFLLLCFAVLVVAGDRLLGDAMKHLHDATTTGEVGRLNWVINDVEAPIVVFGTSRALHHYVPQVMTDSTGLHCCNCGFEGLGITTNYALIRALTQRYQPRLIIYELSYYYDLELAPENSSMWRVRRMASLTCRDSLLCAVDPWERLRMCSHIYPYNSTIVDMLLSRHDTSGYDQAVTDHGYWPLHGTLNSQQPQHTHRPRTDVTDPNKLAMLADLMARYHDRLLICSSPSCASELYDPHMYAPVKALAEQHGVPFLEMDTDTAFVGHDHLWDDRVHLNHTGARLFTARVAHHAREWLKRHQ